MSGSDFNNIGMQKSPTPPVMHLSFGPEMYAPVAGNGDGSMGVGEAAKKKRGRPRKYGPEGPIPVPLSSAPPHVNISQPSGTFSSQSPPQQQQILPHAPSQQQTPPHDPSQQQMLPHAQSQPLQEQPQDGAQAGSMRKARGRPPGSKNKHKQESIGALGIGFTPHVITVNTGEDVASRILSFSQTGPRAVCILSANGAISNVTLRQASTSGGSVTYEGRFEILSLSGSFMLSDSGGQRGRSGGLSVSLAGPDGRVLGGGVAGLLIAASPVQVVVGSFIAEGQRDNRVGNLTEPLFSPPKSYAGSGPTGPSSPPSRGTLSESSGGGGSPLNQSTGVVNSTPVGMSNLSWK